MNYILKNENSLYYECGYSCDNAIYLRCGSDAYFVTDNRYTLEAKEKIRSAEVVASADIIETVRKLMKKSKLKKVLFDPKEWSVQAFEKLSEKSSVVFKQMPDFSQKKRIIKSNEELLIIEQAVKYGKRAFDRLAKEFNKLGFGEDEYLLTYTAKSILSDFGSFDLSFDPIVALNANAAKPHALPTHARLAKGDLLLVDAGLKYERYCSDRTRTVFAEENFVFDTEQHFGNIKIQKAYDAVLRAHDVAIEKCRSGMKAKKVDAIAREIIEKAGFGSYFVHSTGHGVGLDIHELPVISARSQDVIEDGMVFTIEPGIYIPGEFGIRIEDMVAMIKGKAVVL